jgi:hypothetical protein
VIEPKIRPFGSSIHVTLFTDKCGGNNKNKNKKDKYKAKS